MAKLRIPYGLPLTWHGNDSADCKIEASPESRCLVTRFMKLTKSQYVLGVISSLFLSLFEIWTLGLLCKINTNAFRVARDGLFGLTNQHGNSSFPFPNQSPIWRSRLFPLFFPRNTSIYSLAHLLQWLPGYCLEILRFYHLLPSYLLLLLLRLEVIAGKCSWT